MVEGRGLNAVISNALYSQSAKDRNHVSAAVFSAEAQGITHRPALDRQLLLAKAASMGGPVHSVKNSRARSTLPKDVFGF